MFGSCKVMICLYFMLSRNQRWEPMAYAALFFSFSSFFLTLFTLPESPRYLYSKGKYSEATKVLLAIQKTNRQNLDFKIALEDKDKVQTLNVSSS